MGHGCDQITVRLPCLTLPAELLNNGLPHGVYILRQHTDLILTVYCYRPIDIHILDIHDLICEASHSAYLSSEIDYYHTDEQDTAYDEYRYLSDILDRIIRIVNYADIKHSILE